MTSNGVDKSRLILGTAGIGMPYGISNTVGQPSKGKAFEILDAAFVGGINTFDTAYSYGSAEDILGQWIARSHGNVFVTSKMRPYQSGEGPEAVVAEVQGSLRRLHLEILDGYLVHAANDICIPEVIEGLRLAKERGLVGNIGASVYEESEAQDALSAGVDHIQVPFNVFDQRFGRGGFFDEARSRNVTVFARSPYLQGLLLMEPEQLPAHLSSARPYLEKFIAVAVSHGLTKVETALGFVLAETRIAHIVVGAATVAQVRELSSVGVLSDRVVARIREMFKDVPYDVRDPRVWSKAL